MPSQPATPAQYQISSDRSQVNILVVGGLAAELKSDWAANDTSKFLKTAGFPVDLIQYDEIAATIIAQLKHAAVVICWHETNPHFSKDVDIGTALFEFAASGRLVIIYGPGGPKLERIFQTWFQKSWRVPRIDYRGRLIFKTTIDEPELPSPYRVKISPLTNVSAVESPYGLADDVPEQANLLGSGLSPVVVGNLEAGALAYIGDWNADEPSMHILQRLLAGPLRF